MQYPIVYDKFDTDYTGFGVAILENATEVKITREVNGIYSLDLVLPRDDEKWAFIAESNYIKVDGQLFIIRTLEENRDPSGRLASNIQCEHIIFELLDDYIAYEELINVSAQQVMDVFLAGTRFKADATRISGTYDFEVEDATPLVGMNQVIDHFKCEYVCANSPDPDGKFLITLYPQIGNDDGVQFRYRKNVKSIRKRTDERGVITRLYVFGKDGLGIETAADNTAGTAYIDSVNLAAYARPKKGSISFGDIDDPDELYQAGVDYLATVDTPNVSYEIDILSLAELADYGDIEAYGLGDTIRTIDEELEIDISARIMRDERYPYEPWRNRVMIANFRPGIEDVLSDLQEAKRVVQNVTYRGRLNTFWLDGIINTMQNQLKASGAYAQAQVLPNAGYLLENTDVNSPDYGALYMGPGIFALADEKVNGEWNWRTFGTGKGFTADEINAGILNAALVRIVSDGGNTYIDETGFHVFDENEVKRLSMGQYAPGKYGLQLKNKAGNVTILDEDGIIQTDTLQEADNVDATHPLKLKFYIDDAVIRVERIKLAFSLEPFRAYSTGAASGGGATSGSSSTNTTESGGDTGFDVDTSSPYWLTNYISGVISSESHSHTATTGTSGTHNHTFWDTDTWADGSVKSASDTTDSDGSHSHSVTVNSDSHTHSIKDHRHLIALPAHSHGMNHTHTLPNHTHDIVYGIYEGTSARGVSIKVDGVLRDTTGYTTDQSNIDLTQWITTDGWHTIELTSTQLGRINASLYIKSFVGV